MKNNIYEKYAKIKENSGSHSPSLSTIKEFIPELKINVDACFLSNPYATKLFLEYFNKEMIETGEINSLLEFYPAQNNVIAGFVEKQLDIQPGHVFISNGAIESIQAVLHRYTKGKMMCVIPTFSAYYEYATDEMEVVYYPLKKENNFNLDIDNYIESVNREKPNTIILINPNNPDGGYIKYNDLKRIVDELHWVPNIIIDESFIHFAYEDSEMELKSIVQYAIEKDNIVVIKSMSKDFGIAGLRAGYAVMSKSKVSDLLKNGFLWNTNGLSEYFFRLYARPDFLSKYEVVRKKYITEALFFISNFSELKGIKVYPSRANFILIEILNGMSSEEMTSRLLCDHGIYVRNCSDKIGLEGEFIRVAARNFNENNLIYEAIKSVLEN
jgi:histidinol-phosphate/aromatic aminotransferase/cobyric acid decarboxylase-like protein